MIRRVLAKISQIPQGIRNSVRFSQAADYTRREDHGRAEQTLLRIYQDVPAGKRPYVPVQLLMALVMLRQKRYEEAAQESAKAIRAMEQPGAWYGTPAERVYLQYFGASLRQTALSGLGQLNTSHLPPNFGQVDLPRVRSTLIEIFPLAEVEQIPIQIN
jgi:hypothetical protein